MTQLSGLAHDRWVIVTMLVIESGLALVFTASVAVWLGVVFGRRENPLSVGS
jgi:hypothetical protein